MMFKNREIMVDIKDITYDSKQVKRGSCFVAIRGAHADGHDYIGDAIKNGASVIVSDHPVAVPSGVKNIVVKETRIALARMSAELFGEPSRSMRVFGVTGTNGKTTITYLMESVLKTLGRNVGVIGTVTWRHNDVEIPAPNTTPMSYDLQKLLGEMKKAAVTDVVMEVSSHALDQYRVEGVEFDSVMFTNLTQDHLDYHDTLDEYYNAKKRLFTEFLPKSSKMSRSFAVNVDDSYGDRLAHESMDVSISMLKYGFKETADVTALRCNSSISGNDMELQTPWGRCEIKSCLSGRFNALNVMAVVACLGASGIELKDIKKGIESLRNVPGRLESVPNDKGIGVFVDYAHTPDALKNVLGTLKDITTGRIITVFGCGGDRDAKKRPLMGEVAASLSDSVIVTSDNPRTEDPIRIIDEIVLGVKRTGKRYIVESDRRKAISGAFDLAKKGDTILIAGKGHENYQIVGKEKFHFDDKEEALKCLGA